jgi:hypothetical protein
MTSEEWEDEWGVDKLTGLLEVAWAGGRVVVDK